MDLDACVAQSRCIVSAFPNDSENLSGCSDVLRGHRWEHQSPLPSGQWGQSKHLEMYYLSVCSFYRVVDLVQRCLPVSLCVPSALGCSSDSSLTLPLWLQWYMYSVINTGLGIENTSSWLHNPTSCLIFKLEVAILAKGNIIYLTLRW